MKKINKLNQIFVKPDR